MCDGCLCSQMYVRMQRATYHILFKQNHIYMQGCAQNEHLVFNIWIQGRAVVHTYLLRVFCKEIFMLEGKAWFVRVYLR
jgi:hypothetical protein